MSRLSHQEQGIRAEFIAEALRRRIEPARVAAIFGISVAKLEEIAGPVGRQVCRMCGGPHPWRECPRPHGKWCPTCSLCGAKGHNRRTCPAPLLTEPQGSGS